MARFHAVRHWHRSKYIASIHHNLCVYWQILGIHRGIPSGLKQTRAPMRISASEMWNA